MKIAICDDEKSFVKQLYNELWEFDNCQVDSFYAPGELLTRYEQGERYDVLFLDARMEPMSGIELGREIRHKDPKVCIVMVSSYLEYAPEGYEINAFRYLMKPITRVALAQVLGDIRRDLSRHGKLMLHVSGCELLLQMDEILCVEAANRECVLFCQSDTISLPHSLNELQERLLGESFFRVHRKYLVNMGRIREFDDSKLTLDNGMTLPISRRKRAEFKYFMEKYLEGNTL